MHDNEASRSYFERFTALTEVKESHELIADCILVEKLPEPERRTASGIIYGLDVKNQIGTIAADRPHMVRVLAVGEGYYDEETGKTTPLNVKPGDVVLVSTSSVKWFSTFGDLRDYKPDTIGLSRESEIQWRFKGQDGFARVFEALNRGVEAKVGEAKAPGLPA
jgi:co-chaperonin GroES (HSP10)